MESKPVTMAQAVAVILKSPTKRTVAVMSGKSVLLITVLAPAAKVAEQQHANKTELPVQKTGNVAPDTVPTVNAKEKLRHATLALMWARKMILPALLTLTAPAPAKMDFVVSPIPLFIAVTQTASAMKDNKEIVKIRAMEKSGSRGE